MTPVAAALLGVFLGVVAGLIFGAVVWSGRARGVAAAEVTNQHALATISQLRSVVILADASGSVRAASAPARGLALVHGSQLSSAPLTELLRQAKESAEPLTVDLDVPNPSGGTMHLSVRVTALPPGLWLFSAEDRTEDHRFTATRRDFIANISHELKTPIGAISLLAEATQTARDDPAMVDEFTRRIAVEARRLNELVSQIIALSRLQSDDPQLDFAPVDVDQVIAASVARCQESALKAEMRITVGGQTGCSVAGDGAQLEAAVTNLLQNAIAYSDIGARIAITTGLVDSGSGEHVELRVSDNGIGIARDDLPRIFERFYRVDPARSRASGGTGLGLSIVKHVASAHGGTVSAWSEPGAGSTFTLRLPVKGPNPV
ncbi:MAG: two-component sensor histidine kinase [Micropruina sp.]|nr:two-component sensor histidine kinase [Micropruina sp.]